jgi:hypothetical protein
MTRSAVFRLSLWSEPTSVLAMAEKIPVERVVVEKTFVGKVTFPASVPERLFERIQFPEDLYAHVEMMGLNQRTVKFLLAALNGKKGLKAKIDLQDIAIKTAMQYSEMDTIIRDLIEKNYASLGDRLDLYRFWVVLLHVKGVRFEAAHD